jgi:hypothetical protein
MELPPGLDPEQYERVGDELRTKPGSPADNERQLRDKLRQARAEIRAKPVAVRTSLERTQANLIALLLGDLDTPGD